jgi:hypothetical protein
VVSPSAATAGGLTVPVLRTAAKWILIGLVLVGGLVRQRNGETQPA